MNGLTAAILSVSYLQAYIVVQSAAHDDEGRTLPIFQNVLKSQNGGDHGAVMLQFVCGTCRNKGGINRNAVYKAL